MSEWIQDLRGALLFETATFQRYRERRDSVLRGALLIVAVALLAALPAFVVDVANGLRGQQAAAAELDRATAEFERGLEQAAPFMQNLPPAVLQQIRQNFETGMQMAAEIDALPTSLPRPLARFLQALGKWLQTPFNRILPPLAAASLATWLGYGIWVMLYAKVLGGRADLREFFGTTALFAAPHLLNVFAMVPVLGALLGLVAYFWGLAIYVKSTAVSHQMGFGRSVLALVLPAIILGLLIILTLLVIILVASVAGGRR